MEQHGISKLDLKRRNRMQVLKILKQRGPTSRIDIAGTLELTRAAVTIITNEMIEQGIIAEIGEYKHVNEKAPRGRKKILIDINNHYKFPIGITVEEDIVSVGLSTLAGDVLDKRNLSIDKNTDYSKIKSFCEDSIKEILSDNCLEVDSILGIGFGIFPTMYSKLRIDVKDDVPDYSKLRAEIKEQINVPLVFDNSVKGTAMANIDFLKTKDVNRLNIAFLQYGNTMNFVVTNLNEPIISYDNRTNFVDKMIINPTNGRVCACGRKGCVESEITPSAIRRKVKEVYSAEETPYLYDVTNGNFMNVTRDLLYTAYDKEDKAIKEIVDNEIMFIAVLINNLYFSTNPQKIVLHRFPLRSDEDFDKLKEAISRIAGPIVAGKVDRSIIDSRHRFLSGCALAIRELFFNKGGYDTPSKKK